jgi:uncharacterized damage-inducible protein DinB
MSKKDTLTEICNYIYQAAQELANQLTPAERQAAGQPGKWSSKDVLNHIALWDGRLSGNLQAIAQGAEPRKYPDYEAINAQDFLDHKDDTWDQVEARLETTREAMLAAISALTEAQLEACGLLPSSQGERPTWRLIAGNSGIHTMMHLAGLYLERGDDPIALQVVEDASALLSDLDDDPHWQGILLYNQACYHALTGHRGQALRLLRQGLSLNPDLTGWSKEDPDLESLRQEPAYQALYAAEK